MSKHFKLGCFIAAIFVGAVFAAGRQAPFVTKVYRNEGNSRTPVYVSCSSTTWTELLPASLRIRRAIVETIASAGNVCLSTATTSGYDCTVTTPGLVLMATIPHEDYSEAVLNCRGLAGAAAVNVHGMIFYDSNDSSTIE